MSFSIFPRTVYRKKSKISGKIEVKEQLGQYALYVQGMIQSGGMIRGIWKKALKRVTCNPQHATRCLILGLGGGTVVKIIDKMFLKAKIVGIEIDPEIIKIGKKFFDLGEIKNLKIINADAIKWVETCFNDLNHDNKRFDLVIIDLYLGRKFPKEVESDEFLKNVKRLLAENGTVIFNRLKTDKTEEFKEGLKDHFSRVEIVETPTNCFFITTASSRMAAAFARPEGAVPDEVGSSNTGVRSRPPAKEEVRLPKETPSGSTEGFD